MLKQKIIIVMAMVITLLSIQATLKGVSLPSKPDTIPKYAPNRIIVKFKEPVAETLEEQWYKGKSPKKIKLSFSLDNLNEKHKAKKIDPVIKNFKVDRQYVENLPKKNKKLLNKWERHLVKRLKRAPKGVEVPDLGRIYIIELEPGQTIPQVVSEYNKDKDVEYAEPDYVFSICATNPNDPCYPVQWPLNNTGQGHPYISMGLGWTFRSGTAGSDINAPEAWDIQTGSSDIVVAVIDSGVDYNHRDLVSNMWTDSDGRYGYDFVHDDNDPMDDYFHGTHVAGIIAADTNNGLDIAGVCWDTKIMAVKFINEYNIGYLSDAIASLYYATHNGADVTSNSWGGGSYSQSLQDAINHAYSQGVVTVAAAGNYNSSDPCFYPAGHDNVIAVGATDSYDNKASFSNYGDWVELSAPGQDILSLLPAKYHSTLGYVWPLSGTSMACPHVAGACALMLAINPYLTPDDANDILMATVDVIFDPNDDICRSNGRLNLYEAVLAVVPSAGYVNLERDYYNSDCNVVISVADYDIAGNGTQDVNIVTSGGDAETVTLTEYGSSSGVFAGTISTDLTDPNDPNDPNSGDGILQVDHDDIITVTYTDANDGTGRTAGPYDTVIIDFVDPNIASGPNVTIDRTNITVTFNTDSNSEGKVLFGTDCNQTDQSNIDWGASHSVRLNPVEPWTDYYYKIMATDEAGNAVTDDNDCNCYQFTSGGFFDLLIKDSDGNDVAWFYGQGNLVLKGTLDSNTTPTATPNDEFRVQDANGVDIAIIDMTNGNMYIKGLLYEDQGSLDPNGNSHFIIKDGNDVVAYIDAPNGNLYLKGLLYEE